MIELAVQLLKTPFLEFGGQAISLLWIVQLLLALVTVSAITRFIKHFLKYRLLAGLGIDGGNELQAMGILDSEIEHNSVVWIRKRLKQLFKQKAES